MRKILHKGFNKFEIFEWQEAQTGDIFKEFPDHFSAIEFLRCFVHDDFIMAGLRNLLGKDMVHLNFYNWTDHKVLEQLAWKLVYGSVKIAVSPVEIPKGNFRRADELGDSEPEEKSVVPIVRDMPQNTVVWIKFQVIDVITGDPIKGVNLKIRLPKGSQNKYTTNADGMIEITGIYSGTCDIMCEIQDAQLSDTYHFVGMDKASASGKTAGRIPLTPPARDTISKRHIALIKKHEVKTDETLAIVAKSNSMTWKELAKFNWGTDDPKEINKHLRDSLGCTKKTSDGKNYIFTSKDDPGILYIPCQWKKQGLVTEKKHTICVTQADPILDIVQVDDYFWRDIVTPTIPYLHSQFMFKIDIKSIFGNDIPRDAIEKMRQDILSETFEGPKYEFKDLDEGIYGYYSEGVVTLPKYLVRQAKQDTKQRWILFLAMLEEYGHHIDYTLRNKYTKLGGDAQADEGRFFAADFLDYNNLLEEDMHFATFHFGMREGDDYTINESAKYVILQDAPNRKERENFLKYSKNRSGDRGSITLKDDSIIEVEFFAIRGKGAIHEQITEMAAKAAEVKYDDALDEGCAWPDVPCNTDSVETCYISAGSNLHKEGKLAYRSHYGDLQYWHSMSPSSDMTNQDVKEAILRQAEKWYNKGLENKDVVVKRTIYSDIPDKGLFYVGKLLHMLQDSYTHSHTIRDGKAIHKGVGKQITSFQSYSKQASEKHEVADHAGKPLTCKPKDVPGALNAVAASTEILKFYKNSIQFKPEVQEYIDKKVIVLAPDAAGKSSGGTHPDYAPEPPEPSIKDKLNYKINNIYNELEREIYRRYNISYKFQP